RARALLLRLAGDAGLELLLGIRRRRQHAAAGIVDRLHVDMTRRPEHREPRAIGGAGDPLADRRLAADPPPRLLGAVLVMSSHGYLPAVFPALRMIVSFSYLMPLPL